MPKQCHGSAAVAKLHCHRPTCTSRSRGNSFQKESLDLQPQSINDILQLQLSVLQQALQFNTDLVRISGGDSRLSQLSTSPMGLLGPPDDTFCEDDVSSRGSSARQSFLGNHSGLSLSQPLLLTSPRSPRYDGDICLESVRENAASDGINENLETTSSKKHLRKPSAFSLPSEFKDSDDGFRSPFSEAEDLFKTDGCWQALARGLWFQNFILIVIILNTLWMAVDIDYNKAPILNEAPFFCQVADNLFTVIFFAEIVIRFMAFEHKLRGFRDLSFVVDFVLVALMVWENWIMVVVYLLLGHPPSVTGSRSSSIFRIFRVFRLLRISRTIRLFNSIPELLILAKAMMVAVRSVMSILVLLGLVIYIFALVFTQLLSASAFASRGFDTVPRSMNALLLAVLCGPDADFITDLLAEGWVYYLIYLLFCFLSQLTIMNMLIGILCEVVANAAESENVALFEQDLAAFVDRLARETDADGNGMIDKDEFDQMIRNKKMVQHLHVLGLDVAGIEQRAPYVFSEHEELSYTDFAHFMSQFRGAQTSKVKDVMDLTKYLQWELCLMKDAFEDQLTAINKKVEANAHQLTAKHTATSVRRHSAQSGLWDGQHHNCLDDVAFVL